MQWHVLAVKILDNITITRNCLSLSDFSDASLKTLKFRYPKAEISSDLLKPQTRYWQRRILTRSRSLILSLKVLDSLQEVAELVRELVRNESLLLGVRAGRPVGNL